MVKTNLLFEAGFAIGDIPLTHFVQYLQITLQKEPLFKESPFQGSFETMYFNDFSPVSSCISNLNMASKGHYSQK
jgi:hypothetical protein